MSYSSCIYGGMCTGCMECQSVGYRRVGERKKSRVSIKDLFFPVCVKSKFELLSRLCEYAFLFKGDRDRDVAIFADCCENAEITPESVVIDWRELGGLNEYPADEVNEWSLGDFTVYLDIDEETLLRMCERIGEAI